MNIIITRPQSYRNNINSNKQRKEIKTGQKKKEIKREKILRSDGERA